MMKKRDDSRGGDETPGHHDLKTIETEKKSIELMGGEDFLAYPNDLDKHSKSVIQKATNEKGVVKMNS